MIFKLLSFSIPRKAKILIYDISGYEYYSEYLKKYSVEILFLRGESLNFYCILFAIFKKIYNKDTLRNIYNDTFIDLVDPKLIITWVDNNKSFYSLSKRHKNVKTVFIQNGNRVEIGDIFEQIELKDKYKHHVDYMCVLNKQIGSYYKQFLSGNTIVTGSLINNKFQKISKCQNNNIIVFISQFCPSVKGIELLSKDSPLITWNFFWQTDIRVIKYLANWCDINNKQLYIAARTNDAKEYDFYNDVLKGYKCWRFYSRKTRTGSYDLIEKANTIVSIDSTLGLEALARGFRVAFISRKPEFKLNSASFGWPYKFKNEGFFWTNLKKRESFNKILDNVTTCSDATWIEQAKPYIDNIMHHDYSNKRFNDLISRLLK